MTDTYIFQGDNPKDMPIPPYHQVMFDQSAFIAETILENRSQEEIIQSVKDYDIYLNEYNDWHNPKLHINNPEFKVQRDLLGSVTGRQGFVYLVQLYKKNDKTPFKHIENPSWSELFAIYTLSIVAYANREITQMEENPEFNRDDYLFEIAGDYVTEAVEASTVANFLHDKGLSIGLSEEAIEKQADKLAQYKLASKNKNAAQVRHQGTNQLKSEFMEFYANGNFETKSAAARYFYDNLPENRQLFPTYEGAIRALTRAIKQGKNVN